MKKTIITVVLLGLIAPAMVWAQDFQMNGTVLVKYNGKAANVTIPAGVTSIGEEAFSHTSLTSITIPSSVTAIGDYAFSACRSLTSITIPSSVRTIGDYAFNDCERLTSVTVSRKTTIGNGAFLSTARITYSD